MIRERSARAVPVIVLTGYVGAGKTTVLNRLLREPTSRMVSRLGRHRFHLGGVIDIVDAQLHASTVDTEELPPMRYAATTLVLVNKLDQLGALDPALLFDPGVRSEDRDGRVDASADPGQGELPILDLIREAYDARDQSDLPADLSHRHAQSITVSSSGPADAEAVVNLLEDLPTGVHRVKGVIAVDDRGRRRRFFVQAVGPNVYVSTSLPTLESEDENVLVVIGEGFDESVMHTTAEAALRPAHAATGSHTEFELSPQPTTRGLDCLLTYVRLHA